MERLAEGGAVGGRVYPRRVDVLRLEVLLRKRQRRLLAREELPPT